MMLNLYLSISKSIIANLKYWQLAIMQRKIDVIASFCNKIAQELIKIEYQENQ